MGNYIEAANVNIQSGLLMGTIKFQRGLNLISGENGTLKTKLLHFLKNQNLTLHTPGQPCRRQAISPRRNAQRRQINQILEYIRRDNIKLEGLINERDINDTNFEPYPALGDLFYVVYDDLAKDGSDRIAKMNEVAAQFNEVIKQIFPHYTLEATWNSSIGAPSLDLSKGKQSHIPLEGLSLGEQEILSLAVSIYASRNRYDVFLIDEPEVHLNWHLEERLFEYLDRYCDAHEKQMIVVTHSRAVFKERLLKKTQFLYWKDDGTVGVGKDISPEQRRRIAGDAIEIIRLGTFSKLTFFVEDRSHVLVLGELAKALSADVVISDCGDKSHVRSLYKYSERDGGWEQSVFVEDGDNEGDPYPSSDNFIHLPKYCMENHLLDLATMAKLASKSVPEVQDLILKAIVGNKDKVFKKNRFFEFLIGNLKAADLTDARLATLDASQIFPTVLSGIALGEQEYVQKYVAQLKADGRLDEVFPGELVELMQASKGGGKSDEGSSEQADVTAADPV